MSCHVLINVSRETLSNICLQYMIRIRRTTYVISTNYLSIFKYNPVTNFLLKYKAVCFDYIVYNLLTFHTYDVNINPVLFSCAGDMPVRRIGGGT